MPTKWSSKKNGVRVGVAYDDIKVTIADNEVYAKLTNPRVLIDRDVNIVDTANRFEVTGGAVVDVTKTNQNVSGSGQKTVFTVTAQKRPMKATTHTAHFKVVAKNIDYAGSDLTADMTITFPAIEPFIDLAVDTSGFWDAALDGTWYPAAHEPAWDFCEIQEQSGGTNGPWVWAGSSQWGGSDESQLGGILIAGLNKGGKYRIRVRQQTGDTPSNPGTILTDWKTSGWVTIPL